MNKVQLLNKYYYYNEPNLHEGYHAVLCTLSVWKKISQSYTMCMCECAQSFSHVLSFATPWAITLQAPQSVESFRQEYCSGLPFPTPGALPHPVFPECPALTGGLFTTESPGKRKRKWSRCRVRLFATPWTIAHQAPPSMGFYRQEQWSGLPFPSPGDLSDPGIEPRFPKLQADVLPSEPPGQPFLYNRDWQI